MHPNESVGDVSRSQASAGVAERESQAQVQAQGVTSIFSSMKWASQRESNKAHPSRSGGEESCRQQGLHLNRAGALEGTFQVPRHRLLFYLNDSSQLSHNPSGSSAGLDNDPG